VTKEIKHFSFLEIKESLEKNIKRLWVFFSPKGTARIFI
jgi:hypothetical protein